MENHQFQHQPSKKSSQVSLIFAWTVIILLFCGFLGMIWWQYKSSQTIKNLLDTTNNQQSELKNTKDQVNELKKDNSATLTGKIDEDTYQAVFLPNGQVYFGKLRDGAPGQWSLTDIYYLQTTEGNTSSVEDIEKQPNISLVKLGGELHGPQDEMNLIPSSVSFWENLRKDSQIVVKIGEMKSKTSL